MLTKGAIGNLINRYRAVLKKCRLMNTFGTLAAAAVLIACTAGISPAFESSFDGNVPELPDFVVKDGTDVGPPNTPSYLDEYQTGIAYGAATGGDTSTLVYADKNNPAAENHGYIWVLSSDKGGYAEGMGGQYNTGFTLTNHGRIYVDGTTPAASKGMGVNPNGKAYNEGIIAVRKGSAMADNSGSDSKTLVNNGFIYVEDADGVGMYYRKENINHGEFTNNGFITVSNGGTGVVITNDKNDASYNNKYFTNTGVIRTDEHSTAILVAGTDNATVNLKGNNSRVDGLIHLLGTNNNLVIDGMGTSGVRNLYVKGSFSGEISNHSNIAFTSNSDITLDDSFTVDDTSSAVLSNVQLAAGHASADRSLIAFNDNGAAFNGGMNTGGTASLKSASVNGSGMSLDGAVIKGHTLTSDNPASAPAAVSVALADGQNLSVTNSLFSDNTASLTHASSLGGGAALAVSGNSQVRVEKTEVRGNTARAEEVRGGALSFQGRASAGRSTEDASLILKDVNVENNTAQGVRAYGGAVYAQSPDDARVPVSLNNVHFKNNRAYGSAEGLGGAVYNHKGNMSVAGGTFTGNSASTAGGALYNAAGSSVTFTGSNVFSDNLAAGKANDVHNAGTLTVASGLTRFDSGYTQQGKDSVLNVNTGATLAVAMPDTGGITAAPGEAMLALGQPLDLGGGKLVVGDARTRSSADVTFGKHSLLVVDGAAAKDGAMLSGTGHMAVDDTSKLYIANARAGESYTVTSGLAHDDGEYWKSANLLGGRLIEVELTSQDGNIVAHTKGQDAGRTLPGIIPASALNTMIADNLNNTDSFSMGVRFLSRAMDNVQYMTDDAAAVSTVNEVSRASVTAGVQNTALRVADAGVDQIAHHLSLSFFDKGNSIHQDGLDIWASPLYGNTYTRGMAASGAAVRGNYGGIVVGADTRIGEIMGGSVRVGAAVNGGGGKSETRGTATSTENSYNFGGVNLYAGWNLGNLNILGSAGYSIGTHDVSMRLPAALNMGQTKADVETTAFVAGLRAEYQINTDVVDILPHAGVRYTALDTDSHKLKVNGSTLNSADSDTQHIVQFPVGVTLTKNIDVKGWNIKPQADVSVIPAAGEKKNTTKVSYAGINAVDSVNTRIMDSTSWAGMVGVQAEKGNFALGLNYGVQTSKHETDQSVSLGISWKF